MKAITICQPFAHLIVTATKDLPAPYVWKRVENRRWPTTYRGPLLIHAGKSMKFLSPGDLQLLPNMVFGAILGQCELVDCVHKIDGTHFAPEAIERFPWLASHIHAEGPFCLILDKITPFEQPVPYQGALGLFNVPDKLVAR